MNYSHVLDKETVARFVFSPEHIRSDGSIRWQVFSPAPDGTSVTREAFVAKKKLISLGFKIGNARKKIQQLHRIAELLTKDVRQIAFDVKHHPRLDVSPAPSKFNPNHANIVNWSIDKDERMMICKELLNCSKLMQTGF